MIVGRSGAAPHRHQLKGRAMEIAGRPPARTEGSTWWTPGCKPLSLNFAVIAWE